jgi:diacylglycerol O-acyltransferase
LFAGAPRRRLRDTRPGALSRLPLPPRPRSEEETMPHRERMSPVDTAWLRMDSPGNLMMIVGVDIFDGRCDLPRLRKVLQEQLLPHMQFRCRVVQDATGVWWEEDEDFDIDRHLVRIGLPGRGGTRELQKLVAQLAGQALDPQRPLWQFHLVENYDHGHALIVRMHHCIADGISLMGLLIGMTSDDPDKDAEVAVPRRRRGAGGAGLVEQWLQPLTAAAVKAIDATGDLARRLLAASGSIIEDPAVATEAAVQTAKVASQVGRDLLALALMEDDTRTSLKGKPGGSKVVAWTEPLSLGDVKAVGRALGCSVNDVLLSCVAGAIGGYLAARGEVVAAAELRAMVPVNLRPSGRPQALGNRFGLVPLLLPIGIDDPIERVVAVRARMNELKDSYTAVLALALLGAVGLAPRAVQKQVTDLLASKATAVMTNVPGPQHRLYMAGSRLRQMLAWVPQSGDIGVGVSILSYDGGVQFGLVTDKKVCAEPQKIIDRFAPEFEKLVYAVLLAPWDEEADPKVAERSLAATEALAEAATHLARPDGQAAMPAKGEAEAPARGDGSAGTNAAPQAAEAPATPARRKRSAFAAARAAARG